VNLGGTILEQALDGQANNNADCTGTITYTQTIFGQPAPDLNIRYVIWDQGDRISGLPVDAGSVLVSPSLTLRDLVPWIAWARGATASARSAR